MLGGERLLFLLLGPGMAPLRLEEETLRLRAPLLLLRVIFGWQVAVEVDLVID